MPDYHEKLGELLSETLETGKVPETAEESPVQKEEIPQQKEKEDLQARINISFIKSKKKTTHTGEIIKQEDYSENKKFIEPVTSAMSTLEISYPFTERELKTKYHTLLKKYHPDSTKTNIQDTKILYKLRQLQTEKINEAYKLLLDFIKTIDDKKWYL